MCSLSARWLDRHLDYRLPMLRGADVRLVQLRLAALGYARVADADGLFGPNTRNALKQFQLDQGREPGGAVDEATMASLMLAVGGGAAVAPPTTAAASPGATSVPDRSVSVAAPAGTQASAAVVDAAWLPPARAKRIICHWTAGAYKANSHDKKAYHFLIEGDGRVVRGLHPVDANDSAKDGVYAAHTRGTNTGSIGVSMCCMAGAVESPFDAGRWPMREVQWRRMAKLVAQLCLRYVIDVTPETVLAHGEVQANLGRKQRAKWDPLVLPWLPELDGTTVGERFRDLVRTEIRAFDAPETPANLVATIAGRSLDGVVAFDSAVRLPVHNLLADLGWSLADADADGLTLLARDAEGAPKTLYLAFEYGPDDDAEPDFEHGREAVEARAYVRATDVAEQLGLGLRVNDAGDRVDLTGEMPPLPDADGAAPWRVVTVAAGDTLAALAALHLGNPTRWREFRGEDGAPFDDVSAANLGIGSRVFLPPSAAGADLLAGTSTQAASRGEAPPLADVVDELVAAAPANLRRFAAEAMPVLVAACRANDVNDPAQIAYVLATAEHETLLGRFMRELWGPTAAQRRYEGRSDLGNHQPGDGKRYMGRGYVQITGRANYQKFADVTGVDLERSPERATDPDVAATIAVIGMREGRFRPGNTLAKYFDGTKRDYVQARLIINRDVTFTDSGDPTGTPRGERIGARARIYTSILEGGAVA